MKKDFSSIRLNKHLIIILVLGSLLLSFISISIYLYILNEKQKREDSKLASIYVAKNDIAKNTLIKEKHLLKINIQKQAILNRPLYKQEIIGKYAKESIYKHEVFLKERLTNKLIKKKKSELLSFQDNAYNLKLKLFKNPNYNLKQNDIINIISVYPKDEKRSDYNVQYVEKNVKILGFLRDGFPERKSITLQKVKKLVNKEEVEVYANVKSDEIILELKDKVVLSLIKDYNKGMQLWMIKSDLDKNSVVANKSTSKVEKKVLKKDIYTLYKPINKRVKKTATISYANEKNEEQKEEKKTIDILLDSNKICSKIDDNFIVTLAQGVNLKKEADFTSKSVTKLKRNTFIPYLSKNGNWYKTCDNNFIYKTYVKKVSPIFVSDKLGR